MAYAIISNLPAIYGLYASLVSLFIYGILGTCGQLSVAPVAILALILREGA
jgi:MFS superfamily sulfate permease-like transporter